MVSAPFWVERICGVGGGVEAEPMGSGPLSPGVWRLWQEWRFSLGNRDEEIVWPRTDPDEHSGPHGLERPPEE